MSATGVIAGQGGTAEREDRGWLGRMADGYIAHAGLVGFLYGAVPVLIWFGAMLAFIPFREVYLLRLVLSVLLAGGCGAYFNRYGLRLWLLKHASSLGPGNVVDGALIGAAIGFGTSLLAPLTSLIATHHLEEAKWFIIGSWFAGPVIGFFWGALVTALGGKHIPRGAGLGQDESK